jgi:two-component system chemotaxis response regulator CheB
MSAARIRALVVDDSAGNRRALTDILESSKDIEVVGRAADGEQALKLAATLRPDVITLDLEMPKMDGFTFLRILMARQPTPVIVVSGYSQKENVFRALELGAIDFVAKPEGQVVADGPLRREVLSKVLLVRYLRVPGAAPREGATARVSARTTSPEGVRVPLLPEASSRSTGALRYLVAIAASTGGPSALVELFGRIPDRFPGAVLIAQHMPEKFTKTFAERLDRRGTLGVREAQDGDVVTAGHAYLCPGRLCMEVTPAPSPPSPNAGELRLRLFQPTADDRFVPSADRLFTSVASAVGPRAIAVVLTGMGDDGAEGVQAVRKAGGIVLAENEASAIVYGMPRAAVATGAVHESLDLAGLGDMLAALV